jgi:hypothetical protein
MIRAARKIPPVIFYHVVCESESEAFYIERLVQFLNQGGILPELTLKAYRPKVTRNDCALTNPIHLLEQAKIIRKDKDNFKHPDKVCILLDSDVFTNGTYNKKDFERMCNEEAVIPLFQNSNFEDSLICHLNKTQIGRWYDIVSKYCGQMKGADIKTEIVNIILQYKKGSIPAEIQSIIFSMDAFRRVIAHSEDKIIPFLLVRLLEKFFV